MRKVSAFSAFIITSLITAALTGVLYAGNRIAGFPFPPTDLLDWLIDSGAGFVISLTSGLEKALTSISNLPKADRLVTWGLALLLFFIPAILIGLVFRWFVNRRRFAPDTLDGVVAGAVFGALPVVVSLVLGRSAYPAVLQVLWLGLCFVIWGISLSHAYRRLATARTPSAPEGEEASDPDAAARLDRRKFLLQLGASTAALTAISAAAGTTLSTTGERMRLPRTYPTAGPEFRRAQRELYQTFRRFIIVNYERGNVDDYQVLALGAEYPDQQYVSIWLGEGSPIVIYQNVETALESYSRPNGITDIIWLDDTRPAAG